MKKTRKSLSKDSVKIKPTTKIQSVLKYGSYPELAQKAIEGANVTCRTMHVILSWLTFKFVKILLVDFLTK